MAGKFVSQGSAYYEFARLGFAVRSRGPHIGRAGTGSAKKLAAFSQQQLDTIVEAIAIEMEQHGEELARLSQEETDYGRWQDKYVKNRFVCTTLRQQLKPLRCVGIIERIRRREPLMWVCPLGLLGAATGNQPGLGYYFYGYDCHKSRQ